MPNCKPGDLAVVISGQRGKSVNIGRIVKVIEPVTEFPGFRLTGQPVSWLVQSADGEPLAVYHRHVAGRIARWLTTRPMADSMLRPIRPPAVPSNTQVSADKPVIQSVEV